jgi:hypothetical protein
MLSDMNRLTDQLLAFSKRAADVQWWIRSTPPWLASLLVHSGLLGLLAFASATMPRNGMPVQLETRVDDNTVLPEFTETFSVTNTSTGPMAESLSFAPAGVSVGQTNGPPSFGAGTVPGRSFGSGSGATPALAALDLRRNTPTLSGPGGMGLPSGTRIDKEIAVLGSAAETVGAGGTGAAIDRLTLEIARSLDQRKTLVIWVLDATASLKPQREEIAQRIDRVYEELGVVRGEKQQQRALLTGVVVFGEKHKITAEPTDNLDTIKSAIRTVQDDETGTENVFATVIDVLKRWEKYRTADRRNVMVIVLTDEKGDDEVKVEEAIALAKNHAKVYVVGASAPLGRPQVMLPLPSPWEGHYAPAERGPESVEVERESLPFWSASGGMFDLMPSGFGPVALTRLCRESGGIYFVMQDSSNFTYDTSTLRAYQPDYVPRKEYERLLAANPIRKAVVEAAKLTKAGPKQIPNIPVEFPGDESQLNRAMGDGQAVMAKLKYFVDPPLKILLEAEKFRAKETSRRWRAEYDLMLGRLMAARVRTYTYNGMCAVMKKKPKQFEKSDSNFWRLRPDENVPGDTPAGGSLQQSAEKARTYLTRVVKDNPNTPWAMMAQKELETDLGFRWEEFGRPVATVAKNDAKAKPKKNEPAKPAAPAPPPPRAVPAKI